MKTMFTLILLAFAGVGLMAQYGLPVDFETPEEDTVWAQFANAGDDPANMALAGYDPVIVDLDFSQPSSPD